MGRVVDFGEIAARQLVGGVSSTDVTAGDTQEFAAQRIKIDAGKVWRSAAPAGSDLYVFTLSGHGMIDAGSYHCELPQHAFATIGEGVAISLTATVATELVAVTTPPKGTAAAVRGYQGALAVGVLAREPVVVVPEQKKTRVYLCGHLHGAETERGHAMVVGYEKDTLTALHHHPNAESLFVMLEGACRFTVNGQQVDVRPGQAAYFTANDRHGLATAPGHAGARFLEFHIPSAFTTVKA